MNIFYLDHNPTVAAQWHVDSHVVKMPLEAAQLLSTCHHVYGSPHAKQMYKVTHRNHPCAVWVRHSKSNYVWTYYYFIRLSEEFKYRYGHNHKSFTELSRLFGHIPKDMPDIGETPVPSCMPDIFKISDDPTLNYKQYYRLGKHKLHKWTKRDQPEWIW